MPSYEQQQREIERRRQLAQMLIQQSQQAGTAQPAGRFIAGPSKFSSIAGLVSALGGAALNGQADKQQDAAEDTERKRLAAALGSLGPGGAQQGPTTETPPGMIRETGAMGTEDAQRRAAMEVISQLPIEAQQQMLGGQALKTLFPAAPKKTDPYAKIDPKDYTADSITKFEQSGNRADLVPRKKLEVSGGEAFDPYALTPGQKVGTPSAGTTVNVNTEKNLYGTMADALGKENVALYGQAQKAPELLQRAQRVKAALGENSQAITGAGAEQLLGLAKVAAQLGFNTGDAAADTEGLSRDLAASTLDQIKSSGLGAGSGFSNADRDFLEKVVGGKITLEAATLRRLADLNEKSALGVIQRWNAAASRLDPQQLRTLGMAPIQMPAGSPAPSAVPKLKQNPDGTYEYTP